MPRFFKKGTKKVGLPPGSLVHVGEAQSGLVEMRLMDYDAEALREQKLTAIEESFPHRHTNSATWIDIDGLHQVEVIRKLGDEFAIHPLTQEDILNSTQRPKVEEHDQYFYIVVKMLRYDDQKQCIDAEQLSLVLGANYLISFQEKADGDILDAVRERLRGNKGRIRRLKTDYLAYALLDTVVDHYFVVLEKLGNVIEHLEDQLLEGSKADLLHDIQQIKKEVFFLRHAAWPLREVLSNIQRQESPLVSEDARLHLRDVYDHAIQVVDTVEIFREMVAGLLDLYLLNLNTKMNEVMKLLALFTSIFIPLSFIAGVYGMNFEYMPELKWHWAYPMLWVIMVGLGAAMVFYFHRKKWL